MKSKQKAATEVFNELNMSEQEYITDEIIDEEEIEEEFDEECIIEAENEKISPHEKSFNTGVFANAGMGMDDVPSIDATGEMQIPSPIISQRDEVTKNKRERRQKQFRGKKLPCQLNENF